MTWMDIEGIMLIEITQTEKHKYHMISFIFLFHLYVELKNKIDEKNKTEADS